MPELRIAIGNINNFTAEQLISRAGTVLTDLRDRDNRNGVVSKLPPLNEHEIKKFREQNKQNDRNKTQRRNFRYRFNIRG